MTDKLDFEYGFNGWIEKFELKENEAIITVIDEKWIIFKLKIACVEIDKLKEEIEKLKLQISVFKQIEKQRWQSAANALSMKKELVDWCNHEF